ncbi:MAG: alkaline phosphatase family protein [Opitutaceae bacterium]|nr:alkaline phosphatase family protein [Opitutaceae bacterium]
MFRPAHCHFKVLTLVLLFAVPARAAEAPVVILQPPAPALVVIISLDQFRYDYLERFRDYYGPDGFNLFIAHGADFVDCHYRHSQTKTAPGHAVIGTGVYPNLSGIIANDWIDRHTFASVSNVGDPAVKIIGLPPSGVRLPGALDPQQGRSPKNLLVPTLADEFKLARGGRPKVIGISNKDRSAIMMSGHLADAAYFMVDHRMVTSTYYLPQLPAWVQAWNDANKTAGYFGQVWDHVLPLAAYAVQGPDDGEGEYAGHQLGRTLPKTIDGGETAPGREFYAAFENTPFKSEVLADFVRETIVQENLGRRGTTDILCVSFSAPDSIGHAYGPDSHEVMDNAIRTDRILAELFKFIDRRVGLKNCTLVLSADHGVAPMPEHIRWTGSPLPAGRVNLAEATTAVEAALNQACGPLASAGPWFVRDDTSLIFYPQALQEKKLERQAAEGIARDALLGLSYVQAAYTRTDLEKANVRDELGRQMLLGFNRERSGDVFFQLKPFFFPSLSTGSTHGSPYSYDTHVPLLWYGVGVTPGLRTERVGVDDLVPTLARILGVSAPPLAEGRILF